MVDCSIKSLEHVDKLENPHVEFFNFTTIFTRKAKQKLKQAIENQYKFWASFFQICDAVAVRDKDKDFKAPFIDHAVKHLKGKNH